MSKSIRVSDELLAEAKRSAVLHHRSPPQQIEHWAQIGRVMESTLSWSAQEKVKAAATRDNLDEALAAVDTLAGRRKAHEVIARTSIRPAGRE